MRRRAKRLSEFLAIPAFAAILTALALAATPASAHKVHSFLGVFGSAAQPTFTDATSIAVDQSSGEVFVLAGGPAPTVSRYNPDGTAADFPALGANTIDGKGSGECPTVPTDCDQTPQNGFGSGDAYESQIAIDNSGGPTDGDIYVAKGFPYVVDVFSADGKYLGQLTKAGAADFTRTCGVAVDSSGAVYVGDLSSGIHKFVPSANPPSNSDNTANFSTVTAPCALAAGVGPSAGFLFATQLQASISKLDSSTGALEYTVSSGLNQTLAVDPASGHVYAATDAAVKEFDASGADAVTSVSSLTTVTEVKGVAVRGGNGDIYVSRAGGANVEVFDSTLVTFPDVVSEPVSGLTGTEATLNGSVNPDGVELDECFFEWGPTTSYGTIVPCAETSAEVGAGNSPKAVHADLSGLMIGTVYHYRLRAANANGFHTPGSDQTFKQLGLPQVSSEFSTDVVFSEAVLNGLVNPENLATTYYFEWGTDTTYGHRTPVSGLDLYDRTDHSVGATLTGLTPDTTYHWRIVATNPLGDTEGDDHVLTTYARFVPNTNCPNQRLRAGPSVALPDCRAYEMVSPLEKKSGDVVAATGFGGREYLSNLDQSSTSGQKLTYSAYRAFGDAVSAPYANQYIASRGADGWTSHSIAPAQGFPIPAVVPPPATEFKAFSPDLSTAWLVHNADPPLAPGAVAHFRNVYKRDNVVGSYEALNTVEPPSDAPGDFFPEFQGSSSDGSHAIFRAPGGLTQDLGEGESALYEWSAGELHLVSVLPNGEASPRRASAGTENGRLAYGAIQSVDNAISDNGTRIFWSAEGHPIGPGVWGKLYLREHPDRQQSGFANGTAGGTGNIEAASQEVTNVTAVTGAFQVGQAIAGAGVPPGTTIAAVGPSTLTLSTSATETKSATALEAFSECTELQKACTIPVSESVSSADARFWTASADGSKAIFTINETRGPNPVSDLYEFNVETRTPILIAHEVSGLLGASDDASYVYLASEEELDAGATAGKSNLYLHHDGAFSFIATLPDGSGLSALNFKPVKHFARVTPDGHHAAFVSRGYLTGYDSTDAVSGKAASQVYIYDAGSEKLTCASCNPSGARPMAVMAAAIPGWKSQLYEGRVLSDDGNRLFFDAYDTLVPQDTNGVKDVYEWETQGTGDCRIPGGCISLISTGKSTSDSEFIDASTTGNDVFFRTASSIDPRDPGLVDIYNARRGGGLPYIAPAESCIGDACQSPTEAPNDPTPASASFHGADNPAAGRTRRSCRARNRHAAKAKYHGKRGHPKRCRHEGKAGR